LPRVVSFAASLVAAVAIAWVSVAHTSSQTSKSSLWGQRGAPFRISSISFPLIGSNYLDDQPYRDIPLTPVATSIQQMKSLGVNDVRISVDGGYYAKPTDNLPSVPPDPGFTPSDDKLIAFIRQLKAAGLGVTMQTFAHIAFDPNGNLLDTVHSQPTDFNAWMAARTPIMLHWAQIAQQTGVDRFWVLGDETQLTTNPAANADGWVNLIHQVRAVYSGAIVAELGEDGSIYSGGRTGVDLTARSIIDAVDIIGIGYFPEPLTNVPNPPLPQLVAAWRKTVAGVDSVAYLKGISTKYSKPVMVGDISFHSFLGDNIKPNDIYNFQIPLTPNQQEQANEIDSFMSVMSQNQELWFLGVSINNWNRYQPGFNAIRFLSSDVGENIQGKLAEDTLRQWYTGQRTTAAGASVSATVTGREVTMSWPPARADALQHYVVEVGSTAGASDVLVADVDATSSRFVTSLPPSTYYLRVRAVGRDGTSEALSEIRTTVYAVAPPRPRGLSASVSGNTVRLSWASDGNAESYIIEMGSGPGRTDLGTSSATTPAATLTVPGHSGTRYVFRIVASNSAGDSAPSNEVEVVVP
jgi:glycosyl hydrolase family 113/fibronectin type III domain protein